ncbi:hypothetical protein [Paraburkholderia kirstenboschensis]|uniref:Uncharacterized protein n=1 Tax=Paraburkholderia kirstenboschensis TaxID=1245436 RepID=A0ABZ0ELA5_9BURK|nr:hypothetical protein [Paraburkholderia kirstenboschensis]WOD17390.1 hypothetical protein RW095_10360 [Paraburkholderia kirstenboschensis]
MKQGERSYAVSGVNGLGSINSINSISSISSISSIGVGFLSEQRDTVAGLHACKGPHAHAGKFRPGITIRRPRMVIDGMRCISFISATGPSYSSP